MLAAPRPEPVGHSLKVCFVDRMQNACHGLLDDFVLQHRYAQPTLPPVAFPDVPSPGGLRSIRSPMHPIVEVPQAVLQSLCIPFPGHLVHACRRASLDAIEAFAQQVNGQMMQPCGELLLLPFLGCSTHALQPLGHAWAALCRSHVWLSDVLLGLRPSLQALRGWLPFLVRTLHRCRELRGSAHVRVVFAVRYRIDTLEFFFHSSIPGLSVPL